MDNRETLSYIVNRFTWTRTNTIQLFEHAQKSEILLYKPSYSIENPTENHNLLYQFQCILTSTNAHFRKLTNDSNTQFGIYVKNKIIIKKQEIKKEEIIHLLNEQIEEAKALTNQKLDLHRFLSTFVTLFEHEGLHQGQLVVMFRETKTEFPQIFKDAWNL